MRYSTNRISCLLVILSGLRIIFFSFANLARARQVEDALTLVKLAPLVCF
jgi:hypothetical protein